MDDVTRGESHKEGAIAAVDVTSPERRLEPAWNHCTSCARQVTADFNLPSPHSTHSIFPLDPAHFALELIMAANSPVAKLYLFLYNFLQFLG